MLWRQSYKTRIDQDFVCPVVESVSIAPTDYSADDRQVWIGGFAFNGLNEQAVWSRLFQSDFPRGQRVHKVFIFESIGNTEIQEIHSLVAPSEAKKCLLIIDPKRGWESLVRPDHPGRGFAAIKEGEKISLLMVGPPTEDAWEEFANQWRART